MTTRQTQNAAAVPPHVGVGLSVSPSRGAAFAALGFISISVQALALRELLVAWRGNEMSLGIALALWLALTGLGSLLGSRTRGAGPAVFARRLLLLGALAPVTVLAARFSPLLFGMAPGETGGPVPLLAAAALSIAPFAIVGGSLFPAAVALAGDRRGGAPAGSVYVLEAAGAVVAGLVVSFALLPHWSALRIALLMTAAAAVSGLLVARGRERRVFAAAAIVLGLLAALPLGDSLDEAALEVRWRKLGFVASRNSVHGRIVVARYGTQESIFENGVLVASAPDRLAAEEAVHPSLLQHPAPARVLLAGGGLGGSLAEVLKHPAVASVDYVELDPELVRAAREELGPAMVAGLADPRVAVHYGDPRLFVKGRPGPYDCVIVNVPDPTTLQLNRLYTVDFLKEVAATLSPGGVVGLSVQSAENYVPDDLAALLATLRASMAEVFPETAALPGDPCHLIGGTRPLSRNADTLSARVERRALDTAFVRGHYLRDRLRPERIASFDRALAEAAAGLNTDLEPTAYYRSLVLWNRQFSGVPGLLKAGRSVATMRNAAIAAVLLAVVGVVASRRRGDAGAPLRSAVLASIAVVGATEITLEIAALTAYQSLYGYVYGHIALITAAFMGGLALGGAAGTRAALVPRPRAYLVLSAGIALVPLGLSAAVSSLQTLAPAALVERTPLFLLVVIGAAVLAGAQFPLAAAILRAGDRMRGAGRLYAADLAGAALAAPVAAVVLLPVMGLPDTMLTLTLLNAGLLVALLAAALRALGRKGSNLH